MKIKLLNEAGIGDLDDKDTFGTSTYRCIVHFLGNPADEDGVYNRLVEILFKSNESAAVISVDELDPS